MKKTQGQRILEVLQAFHDKMNMKNIKCQCGHKTMEEHCRAMHPAVKDTYRYIMQEFDIIERAMKPLRDHLAYLKEIGALEN